MKATKNKNIETLSKQEKIDLIRTIEERDRKKKLAKPTYKPHPGQLKVHLSKARERYCFASNSFGKSVLLINEVVWAALGYNPITDENTICPANIIVVLDSPEKVAAKFKPEAKKWFALEDLLEHTDKQGTHAERIWTFKNGSTVRFYFFDQDQMKFEGVDGFTHIFTDEPLPKYIYTSLLRGTREKGTDPKMLLVGTPLAAPWLRTDIYEPWSRGELPDVECFKGSMEENRSNLREGYIEHFSSRLSEQERRVRMHGDFFDLSGLAFGHLWDRSVHIIPPTTIPESWNCVLAIDFHPRKKHTAVVVAANPDGTRMVVAAEFAERGVPSDYAIRLADWLESVGLLHKIRDVVCDSLGNSELTGGQGELSFIAVLNKTWAEEGIKLRCRGTTFQEKSDEAIIQMLQEYLFIPHEPDQLGRRLPVLQFFETCKASIFDMENLCWLKERHSELLKPKLDTKARDYFSCVKYALAAQPHRIHRRGKTVRTSGRSPWSGGATNKGDKWYNNNRRRERDDND